MNDPVPPTDPALLSRLERYLDAVPRSGADAQPIGALTLFTRRGAGGAYYARPTPDRAGSVTVAQIEAARRRQRELGLPEAFEWLEDVAPAMRGAAEQAGLRVERLPLMVLARARSAPVPPGVQVRMPAPDDRGLAAAHAVADVAFSAAGTATGPAGVAERDAAAAQVSAERLAAARDRMRRGLTLIAVADEAGTGPVCVGWHQPVGPVTEIVGVGTLPSARRRGLAGAVTARLVADAVDRGVSTVFLTAGSDDVARVYARIGFVRVGTSCIAEADTDRGGGS